VVVDAPDREFAAVNAVTSTIWSHVGPLAAASAVAVIGEAARPRRSRALTITAASAHRSGRAFTRAALLVGGLVGVVLGVVPFGAIGVAVASVALARRLRPIRIARRRRAAIEHELPDAMDRVVLSVRAGLTPFQAIHDIARWSDRADSLVDEAFGEVVRRTERGQPFADALGALPELLGDQAGGLADVIATSDRHGLPLGPVLDQLAAEVRAARRRLDQTSARKLPVRLSFPLVLCTLPSFVLLAIAPAVIAALSSLGAAAW
jgi:tight adherence protein C